MSPATTLLPPLLEPQDALFLDFDGTLVDLAPTPESIHVDDTLLHELQALALRQQGAVAIISGRALCDIDRWLAPLTLPAAGVHGAERRSATGITVVTEVQVLQAVADRLQPLVDSHPGLVLERKRAAVALHYRLAPELEPACRAAVAEALAGQPALKLLQGKCVLELLPQGIGKGEAIAAFLAEAPFDGRRPVFVGDDVTDEAGFDAVLRHQGIAVKVGPGESLASHRLQDTDHVRRWLALALNTTTNNSATHVEPVERA
jgi:trehalose 6-phosphate phosphatase